LNKDNSNLQVSGQLYLKKVGNTQSIKIYIAISTVDLRWTSDDFLLKFTIKKFSSILCFEANLPAISFASPKHIPSSSFPILCLWQNLSGFQCPSGCKCLFLRQI